LFKILDTTRLVIKNIFLLFIFCLIAGIFIAKNFLSYALGLSLGVFFSVIKLIWIEKNLNKCLEMKSKYAQAYIISGYFLRYILTGVVAFVIINTKILSITGFFLGMILLQIAAYITGLVSVNKTNKK
jgi:hypothetical protein